MPGQAGLNVAAFLPVRGVGMGGLVTKLDAQDIQDTESPDLRNIVFDGGLPGPRNGTTLKVAAPVGETGMASQLLKAKDSAGNTYFIAVYGTNFYLFDPKNIAWIKITGTFVPTKSGLFYGSANWNIGSGQDAFYFCNGVDYVMKWIPFLSYLKNAALVADTYLDVNDASLFPESGTINVGGTSVAYNENHTGGTVVINAQPANNDTLTLKINGTSITFTFVTVIGAAAGNVLIGATAADTLNNLLGLLQNPGTTSATQVALSAGNQTLVGYFTYAGIGIAISMTPSNSVYALNGSTVTVGNSLVFTNPLNRLGITGGTVGANIAAGVAITNSVSAVPQIPIGNILAVGVASGAGFRLFVGGVTGSQNLLYFSKAYNWTTGGSPQEDFRTATGTFTGGAQAIVYGEGGILDLIDFGAYLAVVKNNALVQVAFTINTTADTTSLIPTPIVYGESIFPVGQQSDIVAENSLYIITKAQGIYQLSPSSTGAQLSTSLVPFSDSILPLLNQGLISFTNGDREFYNRKIYWPCSSVPGVNNLILVADLAYKNWSIWDNLNAVSIKEKDGTLYFLSSDDGGLYYLDPTSYQDFRGGNAVGYSTYLYTKQFDFGKPANPKQSSLAMIQGAILSNTKIYCDVLFNEAGSLAAATYIIDGNGKYVNQIPVYGIGRASLGTNPIGGFQTGVIGIFRVYLDLLFRAGSHVIQFKFYTMNPGDQWAIMGVAVNPEEVDKTPPELTIGVT